MKSKDILKFSLRLLVVKRGRMLLVFSSIFLGSFLLALFFSFSGGLKKNVLGPLTQSLQYENLIVLKNSEKKIWCF